MKNDNIHDSAYSWARLLVTLAIAMVANAGMWAIIVIMPEVEAEFGAGRAEASLPYTLTMIGFGLGNLLIGRLVDRFGITLALNGAAAAIAAGFSLATLMPGMLSLSAAHLLLGLGTAVGFGPLIADISHWFMRRRGIAVALVASGNYLSGAIGRAISGLAADRPGGVMTPLAVTALPRGRAWCATDRRPCA
ncbi:MAG: MFS transporter [Rhodobacteraceae bacterium]|nr:MFS transporter [Paracoccaceae bacterium]